MSAAASSTSPLQPHTAVLEVELKLALPASQAERLKRHPALRAISPHRAVVAELDAIYFDTPDLALQAQGIAVRLRQAGGRWVQTVKARGDSSGGLHSRLEWEGPSDGTHLDFSVIADAEVRQKLQAIAAAGRLAPIFRTRFQRWARLLVLPDGSHIELALDQGNILVGELSCPISEIELELKAGHPRALFDLALALLPDLTLHPEQRSKAERGYALHSGESVRPYRVPPPRLDTDMDSGSACAGFLAAALEQMQRNLAGACRGEDPEFLHQARVALRRLRATLGVFRREIPTLDRQRLGAELRWLMGEVGPARDWDVLISSTLPELRLAFAGQSGMDWLAGAAAQMRDAAQQRSCDALTASRSTGLLLELGALACTLRSDAALQPEVEYEESLVQFARRALRRRARAATMDRARLAGLDDEGRHGWRIALKKLRYSGDFLAPLLVRPARVKRWVTALSSLQDILGGLNDAATTHALLAQLDPHDDAQREAIALLRGYVVGASQARLSTLETARRRLQEAPTPWKS